MVGKKKKKMAISAHINSEKRKWERYYEKPCLDFGAFPSPPGLDNPKYRASFNKIEYHFSAV